MIKPAIMRNRIQEYAWGSRSHIQALLGVKNKSDVPWAELWMGAHPKAPSEIEINGTWMPLDRVIEKNPDETVGNALRRKFGDTLPFLFKALAAGKPLSIQAHPDSFQAAEGFSRENQLSIPIGAPFRNYRDNRHKPECICALTPFTAVNGFRPIKALLDGLSAVCPDALGREIAEAGQMPEPDAIRFIFEGLLRMRDDRRKAIVSETVFRAGKRDTIEAEWIQRLYREYPDDIGILAPVVLNLVVLEPGEAMFLPARRLHAYFNGFGIELMANSDNVLRGGLTPKHIDIEELLKILDFSPSTIEIMHPEASGSCERQYPGMAEEFRLSVIRPEPENGSRCIPSSGSGPEILFCVEKECTLEFSGQAPAIQMRQGDSVFIPAWISGYEVSGNGVIYRARVFDSA